MHIQDTRQARDYFAQKLAFVTGPYELDGQIKRKEAITIVDVRLPSDYRAGHIPGAINLPQGKWHTLAGLSKDRTAVIYCYSQTCKLAAAAAVEIASAGIRSWRWKAVRGLGKNGLAGENEAMSPFLVAISQGSKRSPSGGGNSLHTSRSQFRKRMTFGSSKWWAGATK